MEILMNRVIAVVVMVIAIGAMATIGILGNEKKHKQDMECCNIICAQLSQVCKGWNAGLLECSYNYERFGYPWITEVFKFSINETAKQNICFGNKSAEVPANVTAEI